MEIHPISEYCGYRASQLCSKTWLLDELVTQEGSLNKMDYNPDVTGVIVYTHSCVLHLKCWELGQKELEEMSSSERVF